ncbi:MAG: hypothetical protein ACXVBY_06970 [Isosphaeraceae bacterium]
MMTTCAGITPAAITGRVARTDDEQAESYIELLDPDGRLRDAVRKVHASGDLKPLLDDQPGSAAEQERLKKAEAGSGTGRFCSLKAT